MLIFNYHKGLILSNSNDKMFPIMQGNHLGMVRVQMIPNTPLAFRYTIRLKSNQETFSRI